ncbi:MAG: CRISPR-associated endonuclease Cas1, partial [Symploca sp. SIO1C4]|nr:CRISPR-associated endonuclease Cas1 [Symploca sp. SIO1C4]
MNRGLSLKVQSEPIPLFHKQQPHTLVPIDHLNQIVLLSYSNLSRQAINLALFHGIPLTFFTHQRDYLECWEAQPKSPAKYLAQQKKRSQDLEFIRTTAESIIRAKLHNCCTLILKFSSSQKTVILQKALNAMALLMDDLPLTESFNVLRSYEAVAAEFYFSALAQLLPSNFHFVKRSQHPGFDPINNLLSLGYALLSQEIYEIVHSSGLDIHFGSLHLNVHNLAPLVSDFMAEFRAPIVEELVVHLAISQIITPEEFTPADDQ